MNADDFLEDFMTIHRRFDLAAKNHLRTPWWRFFKAARHLREMHQANLAMEDLNNRLKRGNYAKPR